MRKITISLALFTAVLMLFCVLLTGCISLDGTGQNPAAPDKSYPALSISIFSEKRVIEKGENLDVTLYFKPNVEETFLYTPMNVRAKVYMTYEDENGSYADWVLLKEYDGFSTDDLEEHTSDGIIVEEATVRATIPGEWLGAESGTIFFRVDVGTGAQKLSGGLSLQYEEEADGRIGLSANYNHILY